MKTQFLALPVCAYLLASCSSTPSGGPVRNAANRLEVTINTRGLINPNYYYGIAFDDEPSDGPGPVAVEGIVGDLTNGVMGGDWRVLVLYHQGRFRVYRRADPDVEETEIETLVSPFLSTRAGANSLNFIFDLDAKLNADTFFFPNRNLQGGLSTERFDINFVATNEVLIGSPNGSQDVVKPVDAFGPATISSPLFNFQINTTRRTSVNDDQGSALADRRNNVDIKYTSASSTQFVDFARLDVTSVNLAITRTN